MKLVSEYWPELAVALVATLSLVLQAQVTWDQLGDGAHLGTVVWILTRYFTVLTNALVAAAFWYAALARRRLPAGLAAALLLWIAMVGIVYHTVLAQLWRPQGLAWWADHGLHSVVPLMVSLWWLWRGRKAGLTSWHPIWWLCWPIAYVAYALVRGGISGVYPYPFIDMNVLTTAALTLNILGLAGAFLFGGLVLAAIARWLSGRG